MSFCFLVIVFPALCFRRRRPPFTNGCFILILSSKWIIIVKITFDRKTWTFLWFFHGDLSMVLYQYISIMQNKTSCITTKKKNFQCFFVLGVSGWKKKLRTFKIALKCNIKMADRNNAQATLSFAQVFMSATFSWPYVFYVQGHFKVLLNDSSQVLILLILIMWLWPLFRSRFLII